MMQGISDETLPILVALLPGYVAFRLYMIDRDWTKINQVNVLFGVLSFSVISYGFSTLLLKAVAASQPIIIIGCNLLVGVALGFAWARWGHKAVHRALQMAGLTNEDNLGDAWSYLMNRELSLTQIIVTLKNGELLKCEDLSQMVTKEEYDSGIFSYYSDIGGNLVFIPTHRKNKESDGWCELPLPYAGERWGHRMTFVKREEIARLDVRVKARKNKEVKIIRTVEGSVLPHPGQSLGHEEAGNQRLDQADNPAPLSQAEVGDTHRS